MKKEKIKKWFKENKNFILGICALTGAAALGTIGCIGHIKKHNDYILCKLDFKHSEMTLDELITRAFQSINKDKSLDYVVNNVNLKIDYDIIKRD